MLSRGNLLTPELGQLGPLSELVFFEGILDQGVRTAGNLIDNLESLKILGMDGTQYMSIAHVSSEIPQKATALMSYVLSTDL